MFMKIKIGRNHLLLGGLALAGAALLVYYQRCGILRPLFKNQCDTSVYDMGPAIADPDPFAILELEEAMPTRPITDDYVQDYNRFINGYREKPTMYPENYYDLPFRYDTPKGILTSPGMPHPFFGSNPMDPEPNWHNNWIRQGFSF
jgi:hypothetical protein